METAISNLNVLPETKGQRETFIKKLVSEVKSGNYDVLKFWKQLINVEQLIKDIKQTEIPGIAFDKADEHPEKTFKYDGAEITKTSKSTYDYSLCNDSHYNRLILEKQRIDNEIKDRVKLLQVLKNSIADPETGEVIYPPSKSTTDFLTIKIK
jgi:hypothetical protein